MADSVAFPIPETFNGQPTSYTPFDGFRNSSTFMKAVYVVSPFTIVGVWAPILIEGLAYNKTKHNRREAEQYVQQQFDLARASGVIPGPGLASIPDLNPDANPRFREAEDMRRAVVAKLQRN
jgi:hypothetical protein